MKRILMLILSLLTVICFATFSFIACGGGKDPDPDPTPNPYPDRENVSNESVENYNPPEVVTNLYFVAGQIQMTLGTSRNTMPQGIQASYPVVFTSSDPSVATVDSSTGTVYAVKEGSATITVENNGRTASYVVNVSLGGFAPTLFFEGLADQDLTVALGEKLNLLPTVAFAGDYYSDLEVAYTLTDNTIGAIDENGIFTPAKAGTTDVTVVVEWRDVVAYELTCSLNVTVIADTHIVLGDGTTNVVELYLTANHGGETYATSSVVEVSAFEGATSKEVILEVVDENGVVAFDSASKTISAVKAGKAILRASFISSNSETISKDFEILVKKPVATYNQVINGFSRAFGVLPTADIFGTETTIVEAYQGDRQIDVEDGKVFDIRSSATNKTEMIELTVYDDNCGYVITVESYLAYITNAQEFAQFFTTNFSEENVAYNATGKPQDYTKSFAIKEGYVVLANDIDMEGVEFVSHFSITGNGTTKTYYNNKCVFIGTFDGFGHIVKNLTFGTMNKYGLFGMLQSANIQNVAFDNVKFAEGGTYLSVIGSQSYSTSSFIKNVFIRVTQLSNSISGNGCTAIFANDVTNAVNLENVVVDWPAISNPNSLANRGGVLFSSARTSIPNSMKNVYVISRTKAMCTYEGTTTGESYIWLAKGDENYLPEIGTNTVSATNLHLRRYLFDGKSSKSISAAGVGSGTMPLITRYDSYHAMFQADGDYSSFGYYWDTSRGIPVFKGIDLGAEYANLLEGTEVTVNIEEGLTLNLDSNILTKDVVWSSSNTEVATVEKGVLSFIKTGTTTITCVVNQGEYTFDCVVNAVLSETPKIAVDGLNFIAGDSYRWANVFNGNTWDFDPTLEYAGVLYNETDDLVKFEYTLSNEIGTFDEDGVFTATAKGAAIVTVSATIYGETFTYQFEIKVTDEIVLTVNDNDEVNLPDIEIYSIDTWGGETYENFADFVINSTIGGEPVNAVVDIEDPSILEFVDNKLVAKQIVGFRSETIVRVSVTDAGVTVVKAVKVIVTKPSVGNEATIGTFSTDDGAYYDETTGEFKSLNTLIADFGDITAATQNGEEITVVDNKVMGVELTALTGAEDVTFTIYNANGGYTITVKAYTKIITNKEEFWKIFGQKWSAEDIAQMLQPKANTTATNASALDNDPFYYTVKGSYILMSDIQLTSSDVFSIGYNYTGHNFVNSEGKAITGTTNWGKSYMTFTGTFDGNGHTIDGFVGGGYSAYGFFGYAKSATIKNVGFTNVTLSGTYGGVLAHSLDDNSVAENIYVKVKSISNYRTAPLVYQMKTGTYNNIIIDLPLLNASSTKAQPVGDAAKDVANWVNAVGYPNETNIDIGGGALFAGYEIPTVNISNVIIISPTQLLGARFGYGQMYFAENDKALYQNDDGSWKLDAQGTSYDDYFTIKNGGIIAASNNPGFTFLAGVNRFNTIEEMALAASQYDLTSFNNGLWDMSTGIPSWKSDEVADWRDEADSKYIEKTVNDVVSFATEGQIDVTLGHEGITSSAVLGIKNSLNGLTLDELTFASENGYVNVNATTGEIAYKTGVQLPATDIITATFKIGGKQYFRTWTVVVDYTMQEVGEIVLDSSDPVFSSEYFDSDVVSVCELGTTNELYNSTEGTLSLTNNTNRVVYKDVHVTTEGGYHYKATIAVYTKIIYSTEEFKEIFWSPEYSMVQTHTITYKGQTYTETFDSLVDTDMVVRNGNSVYMKLSDEFVAMLADGATRSADSTTIKAKDVTGAYLLGANIENLGSNSFTYTYNYLPRTVTAANAKAPVAGVTWGTNSHDAAGYKLAGANAYLYEQRFTGVFNGNGHTISGFVSATQGGLFGTLNNATIENLAIVGVDASASASTGIIAYQNIGADTVVQNAYIQLDSMPSSERFGVIYYNNNGAGTKSSLVKDVVIVMPTKDWDYTKTFGAGIIGSSTSAGTENLAVTENVLAITGTDIANAYGHASNVATRRVWVAENDANLIATGGKYSSTVVGTRYVQTGLFRYNDVASAIAAGKTTVGNWVITAEGIVWTK